MQNSTLPIFSKSGYYYRHLKSTFSMYAFSDLTFHKLSFDSKLSNQNLKDITVCAPNGCLSASDPSERGVFVFQNDMEIKKGDEIRITFNDLKADGRNVFELDLVGMKIDDQPQQIVTYRRLNTDSSFLDPNLKHSVNYTDLKTPW